VNDNGRLPRWPPPKTRRGPQTPARSGRHLGFGWLTARVIHHAVPALRTDLLMRYAPAAAADAERDGAYRQAAQMLKVALDHADELEPADHARLLTRRAYSLYVVNEYIQALPDAAAAVAVAERSSDPVVLAEALLVQSRIAFFARGPGTARQAAGAVATAVWNAVELAAASGHRDPRRTLPLSTPRRA
jgi:hypothetical protein